MRHDLVTRVQSPAGGPSSAATAPSGFKGPLIDCKRAKVFEGCGDKAICIRSFESTKIPGYEGEVLNFTAGRSWVGADHPAVRAFPDSFALDGSREALRCRNYKPSIAERVTNHRKGKSKPAASREPHIEVRSDSQSSAKPPWRLDNERALPTPHTRRPRAVTGEEIYDLGTVRGAVIEPQVAARELRDRAMRSIERSKFPHGGTDVDSVRAHLAELIDRADDSHGALCLRMLKTGSREYRDIFSRAARGAAISPDEKRAMSLDGPSGGFALPYQLDPTVIPTSSPVANPLRAISRRETTLTDVWKGVGSDGLPKARYRAEGTESEDGSPKFSQPEVKMEGADWWAPAAYEMGQDWGSLEPTIASMLARAKDELEAEKFLTGTGEDEPFGLLTGATEIEETAEAGTFAVGDLETLEEALPSGFLERAQWLGNRTVFKIVAGFDTEGGARIWVKQPGQRPEINGLGALALSTMASTLEGGEPILVLGDFENLLIVDRIGMSVRFAETFGENRLPTGEMGVFALWRNGSKVLAPDAFRVLTVKDPA